jgi:hypothetical protein
LHQHRISPFLTGDGSSPPTGIIMHIARPPAA